ncbi:soluble lytic murein transglycosylase-like protein [Bacillus pakistanensis]|uniref:Soluble lytic murein transglycosylase-like protein n=1 Tax=Rossellomorea pakistanensis TaxID=992288 RepID=A0ABS2NCR4_9BACI|nr:soluble lytic murein transglycosylase-like protein [Bacillus pakistanensis]
MMQSSESIGLPPGTITDPEYSIQIGVKYFAEVMKQAKGDIHLAFNLTTSEMASLGTH